MAEKQENIQEQQQIAFLISDVNNRLRDLEERNNILRERILLLGKNLISIKETTDQEIQEMKKTISNNEKQNEKTAAMVKSLLSELNNFVRKNEIVVIERMLKDFEPLKFVREKDVQEMIEQHEKEEKQLEKEKKALKKNKSI